MIIDECTYMSKIYGTEWNMRGFYRDFPKLKTLLYEFVDRAK